MRLILFGAGIALVLSYGLVMAALALAQTYHQLLRGLVL